MDGQTAIPLPHNGGHPPRRVQLSRRKGARKPPDAVVVARPSAWGNPYLLGRYATAREVTDRYRRGVLNEWDGFPTIDVIRQELAGRDLACWCDLTQPCHADVLLEFANTV